MIGAVFSLAFMLLFMLMVMVNDFLILVGSIAREMEEKLSHDTHFFPDHLP